MGLGLEEGGGMSRVSWWNPTPSTLRWRVIVGLGFGPKGLETEAVTVAAYGLGFKGFGLR